MVKWSGAIHLSGIIVPYNDRLPWPLRNYDFGLDYQIVPLVAKNCVAWGCSRSGSFADSMLQIFDPSWRYLMLKEVYCVI